MEANELKEESQKFIIYLYKHFIKIRNIIENIRNRKDMIDADDCDVIEPLHEHFLEERRMADD